MPESNRPIEALTVYCSASTRIDESYHAITRRLAELMGEHALELVYGGGKVGLMGTLSKACREHGCRVTGIITERLKELEQLDPDNDKNIVVRTMRDRKALLEEEGDAMVVLPGGFGTLDEMAEMLTLVQTNKLRKGMLTLIYGSEYWKKVINFDAMVEAGTISPEDLELFRFVDSPEQAFEMLTPWLRANYLQG